VFVYSHSLKYIQLEDPFNVTNEFCHEFNHLHCMSFCIKHNFTIKALG